MNCAFTQLVGPTFQANTAFFPIDLQVKIALDVMEYLIARCPRWNIINVKTINIRETGVDAVQEVAFVLSLACDYVKGLLDRGLPIDALLPGWLFSPQSIWISLKKWRSSEPCVGFGHDFSRKNSGARTRKVCGAGSLSRPLHCPLGSGADE